ncbi:MAG TPA: malate synthase A [Longimicrobiales bacterium]|nr:malate synthase A [Longimicrobiales bacterium]
MSRPMVEAVSVEGPEVAGAERVLTPEALAFVRRLHDTFDTRRLELLRAREVRQKRIDGGEMPDFLKQTRGVRDGDWRVAPAPADLERRTVEITGPVDRKMMINALNSGANVFMADFEDSLSPTWENVIAGQVNLQDAIRRELSLDTAEGKSYRLNDDIATLVVRPRGWHLPEKHVLVDGTPVSASLFDVGVYFFHNAEESLARGTGPYFYLPKLESHLEARLWNDVFVFAQDELGIPQGSIRATVLIETILAALEMDEILYELRAHASGLNAGRWDYIFSVIKKFRNRPDFVLPDRGEVTMRVPFMRAYAQLLVRTCHRRGAHAMGGMAAFIPTRKDPELNEKALAKVRDDKVRESRDGFDGTWVAHPDLVPVARTAFEEVLEGRPHQKHELREDVDVAASELLDVRIPDAGVTREGVAQNVAVAILYIDSWLRGVGAAALFNLMEDAATAEISRAQLWQWRRHSVALADGDIMSADLYREVRAEQLDSLREQMSAQEHRLDEAAVLLDRLVLDADFVPFLTLPGYERLA